MVLLEPVLAFKLLDSTGLSHKERQLVLTATSTSDFSSMKSAFKRIFGGSTVSNTGNINIKEEPVYLTSYGKRGKQRYFRQNRGGSNSSDKSYRQGGATPRGTNPLNRDGTMSKCAICQFIFHWAKYCPDGDILERVNVASHEKEKSNERPGTIESLNLKADESVTVVTTKELSVFVSESFDSAVIDTACTSTVCGRKWLDRYVSSLEVGQQK